MELRRITIDVAFQDCEAISADALANALVMHLVDGLSAEVAYTTLRAERRVERQDWSAADGDEIEAWQEAARQALDIWCTSLSEAKRHAILKDLRLVCRALEIQ